MSTDHPLVRHLARYPAIAVLVYAALVAVCAVVAWLALADLYDRHLGLAAATDMLDQLEGRKPSTGGGGSAAGTAPPGSPFLDGPTLTVAGAALQQRVSSAVTKLGGNVLSSQVELQGAQSKEGFVSLIASAEVDQPALQQLLYDIEAGMPFLFVDQLEVQAPQAGTAQDGRRMHVLITVSGQWKGAK
jgi:general secretion pathway protein M